MSKRPRSPESEGAGAAASTPYPGPTYSDTPVFGANTAERIAANESSINAQFTPGGSLRSYSPVRIQLAREFGDGNVVDSARALEAQAKYMELMGVASGTSFNDLLNLNLHTALLNYPASKVFKFGRTYGPNYIVNDLWADFRQIVKNGSGVYIRDMEDKTSHAIYIHVETIDTVERYTSEEIVETLKVPYILKLKLRITVHDPNYSRKYWSAFIKPRSGFKYMDFGALFMRDINAKPVAVKFGTEGRSVDRVRLPIPFDGETELMRFPMLNRIYCHHDIAGIEGKGVCFFLSLAYQYLYGSDSRYASAYDTLLTSDGLGILTLCIQNSQFRVMLRTMGIPRPSVNGNTKKRAKRSP